MLINRHIFGHEQKLAHADNLLKAQPSSFLQEMFFLDLLQKKENWGHMFQYADWVALLDSACNAKAYKEIFSHHLMW